MVRVSLSKRVAVDGRIALNTGHSPTCRTGQRVAPCPDENCRSGIKVLVRPFPSNVVRIDCPRCDRAGSYRRDGLVARFGAAIGGNGVEESVTLARSRPSSCVCASRGRRGRGSPERASPRSMVRGWANRPSARMRPSRAPRQGRARWGPLAGGLAAAAGDGDDIADDRPAVGNRPDEAVAVDRVARAALHAARAAASAAVGQRRNRPGVRYACAAVKAGLAVASRSRAHPTRT